MEFFNKLLLLNWEIRGIREIGEIWVLVPLYPYTFISLTIAGRPYGYHFYNLSSIPIGYRERIGID